MRCSDTCRQERWTGLGACYYCLKQRAGLIGSSNGHKLTEPEQYFIGVLPRWTPDPRSLEAKELFEFTSMREDNYAAPGALA